MLNACAQSVYQVLFPSPTSCQNSSLTEGLCFLLFLLTGYSRYSQCKRKENETICTKIVKNIPYGYVWHSRGHRHLQASLSTTDSKYSKLCSVYGNVNIFPFEQRLYPAIEHIFVEVVMTYEQNDKKKNIKIAHPFPVEKSASSGPDYTTDFCLAVVELQEVNCYMHISALLLCATKQCMHKLLAS